MIANQTISQLKLPALAQPAKPQPRRRRLASSRQVLRFSPTAWAKLLFFRDRGGTEIGGFGITPVDDLLYVQDFLTVRQDVTVASISFSDSAVADFFDRQVDGGLKPVQFGRIWLHTHPGESPQPSFTDEETFDHVFGSCQHAVMFILASGGQSYARMRFNVGPCGNLVLPVETDYTQPFDGSDIAGWDEEFKANIHRDALDLVADLGNWGDQCDIGIPLTGFASTTANIPEDWLDELEKMAPAERQAILEELDQEVGQGDPWEF